MDPRNDFIMYRDGYKYQLADPYIHNVGIYPEVDILTEFVDLLTDGTLIIRSGYAWDGPSGPTIDTKSSMRGSLVHDALYQLMRMRLLDKDKYRDIADELLYTILIEDGMWKIRAWFWRREVKKFAAPAADYSNRKHVKVAP